MRIKRWLRRHRVIAAFIGVFSFLLIALPSTVASWWTLVSDQRIQKWIANQHLPQLAFSPQWITTPVGGAILLIILWAIFGPSHKKRNGLNKPIAITHKEPSAGAQEPVGFLQLDKLNYEQGTGFIPDKPFTVEVWFTAHGSFPVYGAQVATLLVTAPVHDENDARIHRLARRAIRQEWDKKSGSQVAIGGSLYCRASVTLSQEEIDRLFSGQSRLFHLSFARWKTASGKRVLSEWDECSWFDPPRQRDFNDLLLTGEFVTLRRFRHNRALRKYRL
jgi:hypothetical protein